MISQIDGKQPGDPSKRAAKIIFSLTRDDNPQISYCLVQVS